MRIAHAASLGIAILIAIGRANPQPARADDNPSAPAAIEPDPKQCRGFGLLAPLFGVSNRGPDPGNPNHRNALRVTGPVASGIGGGYYRAVSDSTCERGVWMLNWEFFGFSEGLDPSKTFQLGLGAGLGLTVFDRFQFGISLGFYLIRSETFEAGGVVRTYSNGLLEWNDILGCGTGRGGAGGQSAWECRGRNFTWLLTFGVTTGGGASDAKNR